MQPLQIPASGNSFAAAIATGMLPAPSGLPRRFKLFLPLYNRPTALSVGVDAGTSVFVADEPFLSGRLPIVWYGTSIAQGGVSFKASNAFTNVVANDLDTEIFNFGFSGNCLMELSVAGFLTTISASAFVIDCNHNMDGNSINASAVPLVAFLRVRHPMTPIVLVEGTGFGRDWAVEAAAADSAAADAALRGAFEQWRAAGDANLFYVSQQDLWPDALDSPCANGLHPSDIGMSFVARFFTPFFKRLFSA